MDVVLVRGPGPADVGPALDRPCRKRRPADRDCVVTDQFADLLDESAASLAGPSREILRTMPTAAGIGPLDTLVNRAARLDQLLQLGVNRVRIVDLFDDDRCAEDEKLLGFAHWLSSAATPGR